MPTYFKFRFDSGLAPLTGDTRRAWFSGFMLACWKFKINQLLTITMIMGLSTNDFAWVDITRHFLVANFLAPHQGVRYVALLLA